MALKDLFRKKPAPPSPLQLNLPKNWNALSTEQMEQVSKILIERARIYTETGHYSEADLLTRIFFSLSGLRSLGIVDIDISEPAQDGASGSVSDDISPDLTNILSNLNKTYSLEFIDEEQRKANQTYDGKIIPIYVTMSELNALIHKFDWILKPSDRTYFPYPELTLPDPTKKNRHATVKFQGPNLYCDGMTWAQYRILCDFMQALTQCENNLVGMQKHKDKYGATRIGKQQALVNDLRAGFLSTLFLRQVPHVDRETGQHCTDFFFYSAQSSDLKPFFADFPEYKFQCVSLWWQGQMQYLSRQFPKVFHSNKLNLAPDPNDDPLKLYTRSTTTMIKYAAESEEEVNRTTYTIILQHLNDMAEENERMKEIQSKHK